jgi:hypothetical protein
VPDRLVRLTVSPAMRTVVLPLHLNWSDPGLSFDLSDRADPARVYEMVLREGKAADVTTYIDGFLLVDLRNELVLPRALRAAWEPAIAAATPANLS